MKTKMPFIVAAALVLIMALGVWNAVLAQRSAAAGVQPALSHLFAPLVPRAETHSGSELGDDRAAAQAEPGAPAQAGDDRPGHDMNDDAAAPGVAEPGDDNGGQNEPLQAPGAKAEVTGTVTAINLTSITIDGQVFQIAGDVEGAEGVQLGSRVQLELVMNVDGTVSVREIKTGDFAGVNGEASQPADDSPVRHESGGSNSGSDGGHHGGSGG